MKYVVYILLLILIFNIVCVTFVIDIFIDFVDHFATLLLLIPLGSCMLAVLKSQDL